MDIPIPLAAICILPFFILSVMVLGYLYSCLFPGEKEEKKSLYYEYLESKIRMEINEMEKKQK